MTKKPPLTVVPFSAKPVDPSRPGHVAKIKKIVSNPELRAAFCVTIDKDGKTSMHCTSDDPMVLSYMMRAADMMVSGILMGEEDVDGEIFLEE
jgi:hypothetical protein